MGEPIYEQRDALADRLTQIEVAVRNAIPDGSHTGEIVTVLAKLIEEFTLEVLIRIVDERDD